MKKAIQYTLSLLLAGTLLWWVFKGIDIATMIDHFKHADWRFVVLSALLAMVAHGTRAARWSMLLEPLGYRPSIFRATLAVWIGYFANLILPRMGEITRCGSLQKTDNIPFQAAFGTVIAERVFDVLSLLLLIALNFILEFDRLSGFFADLFASKLGGKSFLAIIILTTSLFGLAFVWFFYKKILPQLHNYPLLAKIWAFTQGLLAGFLSIRQLKRPWLFLFYTVLIWLMYYFMAYVLFLAIPQTTHLGWLAGLTVLVVGSIGMAAPVQGGIGPYHLLVGSIAVLYGLSQTDGIMLATFIHGSQTLAILFFGGISFLITLFLQKKNTSTL